MIFIFLFAELDGLRTLPTILEAKESSAVSFSENEVPSTRDSYALCKV